MVDFNNTLNITPDPNYSGAVKEASRFDYNAGGKYDKLWSGLTSGVKGVVDGAEEVVKGLIKSDVQYGVDKLRGAQGVDVDHNTVKQGGVAGTSPQTPSIFGGQGPEGGSGTGLGTGGGSADPMRANKPPNEDGIKNDYSRIQAAYNQGKISDRNYYAQLEVMNRSLRSRYPGYRDEVDAMVQNITGVTPANALRKAVLSDLQTAQSSSDALTKERQKFIISNMQYLPKDTMDREAAGKGYSMAEMYKMVQPQVKAEADIKDQKAQLELKAAKGSATSTDALQVAQSALGRISDGTAMAASNDQNVTGFMQKILQRQQSGKDLTPEEYSQMSAQFQQIKFNTRQAMVKAFDEPLTPGSRETLRTRINDPGKINQLIEQQLAPFDLVEKSLTDKNLGLFSAAKNWIENTNNDALKRLYNDNDHWKIIGALGQVPGGQEAIKALYANPTSKLMEKSIQATLNALKLYDTADPNLKKQPLSWDKQFEVLGSQEGGKPKAATLNQFVDDKVNILTNPSLTPEMRANAARVAFNPENVNFLNKFLSKDGSQMKVFTKLTSPEVTKEMIKLRDASPDGQAIWKNYSEWSKNNFIGLFKQAGDGITNSTNRNWLQVNWNPKAKQFEVSPTEEGIKANANVPGSAGHNLVNFIEGRLSSGTVNAVDRMNAAIKTMDPILSASGYKTEDEIKKLVNFNALKNKESSFWGNIVKAANNPANKDAMADQADIFGGSPVNFTQPPGGNAGRLSLEKDPSANLHNPRGADVTNLSDSSKKMLKGLIDSGVVQDVSVTSGYRDPERNARAGGAKYSTHLDGDAIDLDISGYSDKEKAAVLSAAIAHGAKGIGVYPGGRSLHIDTRDTPATWGYSPWGKYRGVHWSSQPSWAHEPLKKLFGE